VGKLDIDKGRMIGEREICCYCKSFVKGKPLEEKVISNLMYFSFYSIKNSFLSVFNSWFLTNSPGLSDHRERASVIDVGILAKGKLIQRVAAECVVIYCNSLNQKVELKKFIDQEPHP